MAVPAPDLRNLTDDQIWDRLHHGMVDSALHKQCVLMLEMRNAEKQSRSASELVAATGHLVNATRDLANFTGRLAWATWTLGGITLLLVLAAVVQAYVMYRWHL
jgi:hypothetical protein